jgi:hypothetical protein
VYISVEQSHELDRVVKSSEVALRCFISKILLSEYPNKELFKEAINSISISDELIYSRRFTNKLRILSPKSDAIFKLLSECTSSLETKRFNNDVPYVSQILDLLLIFFNTHFSEESIVKDFSSIEEFHFCCTIYHQSRNDLSHPASRPTKIIDANKIIYFVENLLSSLESEYFWFASKESIKKSITKYRLVESNNSLKYHNLNQASSTHKALLCRDNILQELYDCIIGSDVRNRLAGSVVLYGYGGVGKTAITTEFLYRLLRDKLDGKHSDIDYLLFFTSKDEYLRENKTTGQLYIDTARPEFSTAAELKLLICKSLGIEDISHINNSLARGIIAIDNIENIAEIEKNKILNLIKLLPRSVQFIVTSRNEEQCEEKIHVEEFKNDELGITFIKDVIDSESFNVDLDNNKASKILLMSRGNALIIVQTLNIISRGVSSFDEVEISLDSMKSKNTEMIANFMYKNTFDNALKYLEKQNYPIVTLMQVISLYDERIELYSISKLAKLGIGDTERICNYLQERLIIRKAGEYYELNEFAKKFVFIKLLPDRFVLANLKDKINNHKARMKEKLEGLSHTLGKNKVLHNIVNDWQPRNYVDKIIIAELFALYGDAIKCVFKNDFESYMKYLNEFEEHSFITNHPYVALQRARLLKEGLKKFQKNKELVIEQIESSYEAAIEAIEYDYRYLIGSLPHSSLLMFFGLFLSQQLREYSRSIRHLEESKAYRGEVIDYGWFITCNYLSIAYKQKYIESNDKAYLSQLKKLIKEVMSNSKHASKTKFKVSIYEKNFSTYIV